MANEKAAAPAPPPAAQTWTQPQPQQPPYPSQQPPPAHAEQPPAARKKSFRKRMDDALPDAFLMVVAFFLPPLAVFCKRGCGVDVLINIFLDFLGWIPGVLHAWYIVLAK